jgi:rhodanese-related sulfurtransferase
MKSTDSRQPSVNGLKADLHRLQGRGNLSWLAAECPRPAEPVAPKFPFAEGDFPRQAPARPVSDSLALWGGGLLGLMLLVQFVAAGAAWGAGLVSDSELQRWQGDQTRFYLVDVRSGLAFKKKHIQGALNIPAFVVARKGLPQEETLVLYDAGLGTTEARDAAQKLSDAGYGRVYLLEGGLSRWEAAGLPLDAPVGVLSDKLVESITVRELAQLARDGGAPLLVDLRDAGLFLTGSIPGALGASAAELAQQSAGWQKDAVIVLFDGGDNRAERQAELLRRAGFKLVRFLYGGYPEWKRQSAS